MSENSSPPNAFSRNAKTNSKHAVLGAAVSGHKGGNPWHDRRTGEFTSGPNGPASRSMTAPAPQASRTSKSGEHQATSARSTGVSDGGEHKPDDARVLKDKDGNDILGASGKPAYIPEIFDIGDVIRAGNQARIARTSSPLLGAAMIAAQLFNFRQSGGWDLQRLNGKFDNRFVDAATIIIGIYAASAGLTENEILDAQNEYARTHSRYRKIQNMDHMFKYLPERNVQNTKIGMKLFASHRIG